ncbi:putative FBD-associated F-box protein At1g50980 [Miscanthus floridulus]|uniref:putative FBD-associated F-box protein At1g50980 n=1 Tax=Miscanthus floridulus TaxID=154761 RepID=UPI00345A5088
MDSTAEDSRNSKRARLAPPPGDVVDRISGLDDDVLLHILELVPDARDAVRTGALSRRWLGLWTRVPALRFASRSVSMADLERFVSFVNGVLARRSQSDCAIESLAISYAADHEHNSLTNRMLGFLCAWQRVISPPCPVYTDSACKLMLASVDAVQGWIRYAVQYRVKALDVDLSLPLAYRPKHWRDRNRDHGGEKKPAVCLGDLTTSPVRLETMRLALGSAGLRLSTTVKFAWLTVLSLENIEIPAGGVRHLVRLVSSASCPRLQKLSLKKICLDVLDDEMRLEAQVLSELVIEHVQPLVWLKLRTPSLRVLHIENCSYELLTFYG